MRLPCLLILLSILISCGISPITRVPVVPSRGQALNGYGPIMFGMPQPVVLQKLTKRGIAVTQVSAEQILFRDNWQDHRVHITQHLSEDGRALHAELVAEDAFAHTQSLPECHQQFHRLWQQLSQQYGHADFPPVIGRYQLGHGGYTRFTFTDSSFIQLEYRYVRDSEPAPRCHLTASYQPAWVTLCLIISNRFCNSDPSTIVQPYQKLPN